MCWFCPDEENTTKNEENHGYKKVKNKGEDDSEYSTILGEKLA